MITSFSFSTPSSVSRRFQLTSEMCSKPCLPGMNSTNAPYGMIDLTVDSYTSPTSGIATIPLIQFIAAFRLSPLLENTFTTPVSPTSSMLISAPVVRWISWIILPPGPITAPINSRSMISCSIRGVCGFSSGLYAGIASYIASRICKRPLLACANA
ncbi:hypothetical protein D3C86_1579050 [compost metagenome]